MRAVATVIMNRATIEYGEFARISEGGNVRNIIQQQGQFVCMRESINGQYNPQNVYNMNPTEEHFAIVDAAISGDRLPGVDHSLFFFNPYSSQCPTYFPTRIGVIHNRVGDHCFYVPTSYYAQT